jgi:hypothetical protein
MPVRGSALLRLPARRQWRGLRLRTFSNHVSCDEDNPWKSNCKTGYVLVTNRNGVWAEAEVHNVVGKNLRKCECTIGADRRFEGSEGFPGGPQWIRWNWSSAIPVTRPLTLTVGDGPSIAKPMSNSAESSEEIFNGLQQIDPAIHDRLERVS